MYFLYYLLIYVSSSLAQVSIKYSAMIYSSGLNTSIQPYPTDPLRYEAVWPYKYSELIDIGKRQHHALGHWFGERYLKASLNRCDPLMIFARSIDEDASIKSIQAILSGMCLQNVINNFTNAYLSQEPVIITIDTVNDDEILAMKKACPEYNKLKQKYLDTDTYKVTLNSYKELVNYLSEHTNMIVENYDDINEIYNILLVESLYNLTLPNWTQAVFPQKLEDPACHSYALSAATPPMARLLVGPLIKEIVNNMSQAMLLMPNEVIMSIYSGNDYTIGNVLTALDLFDGKCPLSTATILMELLYDNSTNDHYVRILYRNTDEMVEPYVMDIPSCGTLCEFTNFTEIYGHLITVNWEADCEMSDRYFNFVQKVSIMLGFLAVLIVIHCAYGLGFCACYNVASDDDYAEVVMVEMGVR